MIRIYKSNKDSMIEKMDDIEKNCWIDLVSPTKEEIEEVSTKTGIDKDLIIKMLDEEEMPRVEIEENSTLIVVDTPYIEDRDTKYSTLPFGILLGGDSYFLTISSKKLEILKLFKRGRIKNVRTEMRSRFIIKLLYENAKLYLKYLRKIDNEIDKTEKELHNLSENEELINVLNIEKSLVYFITSLNENKKLIDKISKGNVIKMYEEDLDLLEDASIENEQATQMANIYREILGSVSGTYATIISNNLNTAMKILTSITIIFSVPTMISSFMGMNVNLGEISNMKYAFIIVLVFSLVISIIIAFIFRKKKLL
ncbi:MAG: magnesium transporter CorA family protein [Bacilli bacterium]|nr:magnesium transporter CorA family protein [Bacilli bacterium]